MKFVRMGSRGSPLAMNQSREIQAQIDRSCGGMRTEIEIIQTQGDLDRTRSFVALGGKGVFTRELDLALIQHDIDFATHSLKDLPAVLPTGLCLAAVTPCIDARDVFVSLLHQSLESMPAGCVVGTSSIRRRRLVEKSAPDLIVKEARGNVDTRLTKLEDGQVDGLIMAAAGLIRLGYHEKITQYLDPCHFVPSIGQGYLAVVCRKDDIEVRNLLKCVDDERSHQLAQGLRLFMARMDGGCQVPLGCHAQERFSQIRLFGYLGSGRDDREVRVSMDGELSMVDDLANRLADEMLAQGGEAIISELRGEKEQKENEET